MLPMQPGLAPPIDACRNAGLGGPRWGAGLTLPWRFALRPGFLGPQGGMDMGCVTSWQEGHKELRQARKCLEQGPLLFLTLLECVCRGGGREPSWQPRSLLAPYRS